MQSRDGLRTQLAGNTKARRLLLIMLVTVSLAAASVVALAAQRGAVSVRESSDG